MNKILLFTFLLLFHPSHFSTAGNANSSATILKESYVLICVSPTAYAYHDHYCRGLKACTHEVKKITITRAVDIGRRPCGYCY